jgi:hypothetical protein
MGISVIGAASSGSGAVNNDFVVDMNDTANNVIELPRQFVSGSYNLTFSSGDTSYDVYLIDETGLAVGYANSPSIVATADFQTVVVLGVPSSEIITFTFSGAVANASSAGDAPGAGAYITSISPTDLPTVDDTANVAGGNFATDVEIYFESGEVSSAAKNIVRSSSTALIVTRPDALDPALDPWSVRVNNPNTTPPSSVPFVLVDAVDAGAVPAWVTTSLLPSAGFNVSYSTTLEATDADGAVTYSVIAGSLPTGLSLNSATGVISGTTSATSQTFTVRALDDGANSSSREFTLKVSKASGGVITTSGAYTIHKFTSTGTFEAFTGLTAEYLVVGAGGGGGNGTSNVGYGGGGGGGVKSSIAGDTGSLSSASLTAGNYTCTVGAGGSPTNLGGFVGGNSSFAGFATAVGGGGGKSSGAGTANGAAGGGGSGDDGSAGGTGSAGGNGGTGQSGEAGAGGGGGGVSGGNGTNTSGQQGGAGGIGTQSNATGSLTYYAGGGGGGTYNNASLAGPGGLGGGGNGGINGLQLDGTPNTGGGGGGGNSQLQNKGRGGSGVVIVRYLT